MRVLSGMFRTEIEMVQVEGENLNSLFDILQEWETILKTCDFPNTVTQDNDPGCGDEHYGT